MVKEFLKSHSHFAKSASVKNYNEATLFPILPLEDLLPEIEREHYFNKIQRITNLPDDYFATIYKDLITRFALFVQIIPERYGEDLGGLLNDGLRRALMAIQILIQNEQERPHPLFVFAIFSIALLSDIGQILQFQIAISDENGNFIDEWCPYLGSMSEFGAYFKLRPYEGIPTSLIYGATPLLAHKLLGEVAVTWLASNTQIFNMWLAFLQKGDEWLGGLGKILKIDKKQFDLKKQDINAFPIDAVTSEPQETLLAEKFLEWLKKGLNDGSIPYNGADSKVHIVKVNALDLAVFLQAPELFQQFANSNVYPNSPAWNVISKAFHHLGLTKLSGADVRFEQFILDAPNKQHSFLSNDAQSKRRAGLKAARLDFKEGLMVNVRTLFGKVSPATSPYLKDMEMRWKKSNELPKLSNASAPEVPGSTFNKVR